MRKSMLKIGSWYTHPAILNMRTRIKSIATTGESARVVCRSLKFDSEHMVTWTLNDEWEQGLTEDTAYALRQLIKEKL